MMIKWKDEYSCYEPVIDEQHRKLIDLINAMDELVSLDDGFDRYDEIITIFDELKSYTVYHFQYEEETFEKYGYDSFNIKIQKLEHKSLIREASAINFKEIDEDQSTAVKNVLEFLGKWLTQHILDTDKKFGEFLKENKKL